MLIEIGKEIVKIAFYSINVFLVLYALYFTITGLFVFYNKKHIIRKYKAKHKLAVIVAARNEEQVIVNLLKSLHTQKYPKELFDIFVVPNNCTDNTCAISLANGAKIIECDVEIKSKGDVLKHTFKQIDTCLNDYDAFCIFDADNIVHPNFLRRMNDTLCSGYGVAQGYRDSKNPHDTWISSCYSLYYWVQNYFFNKARMNMGWSSSINGTGFMVSKEVIKKHGFNPVTVTEDIEFAAMCALNNEKIAFVNDAITYDEQPLTFKQSWKQRKRWSVGTLQCLRIYSRQLFKTGITKNIPQAFDMSLFFLAPIVQVAACVMTAILIVYNVMGIQITDTVAMMFGKNVLPILLGYLITILVSAFVLIMEKKNVIKTFKGVITLAIFMLTWVPINIMCMFKKDQRWEQIEHSRNINIESMIDNEKVK